ncbi:MAG: cysteine methyltransferase [Crocinitomicaceae bacterium]|nr:cysteine methyltransferase [Crocinitomicaceae bacterium]|tara:strand:+ start:2553 stop:3089 length:537 start_codon:yes stop_codon:yes gene_type:complete
MEHKITIEYFKTPFGELILGAFQDQLCLCDWRYRKKRDAIDHRIKSALGTEYEIGASPILEKTKLQLTEYFNGERAEFDVPLLLVGSDFQKLVWNALLKIPFGKTQTYLELSRTLGNEKAIRAVASANGANAISVIVPCHRIVGSDGSLTGYAGGVATKKKLLQLEGAWIKNQLDLFD